MSRRRSAMCLDEIYAILEDFDDDMEECDIVIVPPEVDALTDEDEASDDVIGIVKVNAVPGTLELQYDVSDNHEFASEEQTSSRKGKKKILTNIKPIWRHKPPEYTKLLTTNRKSDHALNFEKMKSQCSEKSPVQLFELFFTDNLMDHVIKESIRYVTETKNKDGATLIQDELKGFVGILFSGYHHLPSEKHYWSNEQDLGVEIVKQALSRNQYLSIKSMLHFTNNADADENKSDKGFKVRPILSMIRDSFQQFGVLEENVAVDEMIIRYFGHHSLKQFIRGKPIRFGYKFWALCGMSGFCYSFDLYCGKASDTGNEDLALGSKVVLNMLNGVAIPNTTAIYFDNLFTSRDLLIHLQSMGMYATGTVRENRVSNCPLKLSNEMKKTQRGSYDYYFDTNGEIFFVKWHDNKCVTVGTNFDSIEPIQNVFRWNKAVKTRTSVPQPNVLSNYNKYMGGVDHHDWLIGKYNIGIRGKKWYWPLFTRVVMSLVNVWILHRMLAKEAAIGLLSFRRCVATAYLKSNVGRKRIGRPLSSTASMDSRFDGANHVIERREQQRRCQNKICTGKPKRFLPEM